MTRKNVVLQDVADELHLSKNAVSRALRDCPDISEATKKRVREVAQKKGYVKNSLAVSFKQGKTNHIAVVLANLENPIFAVLCNKVFNYAKEKGYYASLFFCPNYRLNEETAQEILESRCVAVVSFIEISDTYIPRFQERQIPIAMVGLRRSNPYLDCFYGDDEQGGYLIGKYFLDRKVKHPAYATDSFDETNTRRLAGFTKALKEGGLKPLVISHWRVSPVPSILRQYQRKAFDGLFCYSDHLAIKVSQKLSEQKEKITIPLAGYDDLFGCYHIVLPIDSIGVDMDGMVKEAVDDVIQKSLHPEDSERRDRIFSVHLSIYSD
jgi:LacI family transcriptional regulator